MDDSKKLKDYNVKDGDTIDRTKEELKQGRGFLISYEPDIVGDYGGQANALMPCGHVVSSQSMTQFLRSLVNADKYIIRCPGKTNQSKDCNVEWSYSVCKRIAQLTSKEREEFELGFAKNCAMWSLGAKECPRCKSLVVKPFDQNSNRLRCQACMKNRVKIDICWICMNDWKGDKKCDNRGCNEIQWKNELLRNCGIKKIGEQEGVPIFRACPKCKLMIEHTQACKHIKCKSCSVNFCYVCLKQQKDQQNEQGGVSLIWQCGQPSSVCPGGVAKRQKIDEE